MAEEERIHLHSEAWSGGESRTARMVARPFVRFLSQEAASGVVLLAATAVALLWVNSPWDDSYWTLWNSELDVSIGGWHPLAHNGHALTLSGFVNDGLMAVFFFVVGLQIAVELSDGEFRDVRSAAMPALAAVGGMVAPAAAYALVNLGTDTANGWGVPMATDIAFAVGVLALLGDRIPKPLKLFVLMLAVVDDIGAIVVIAVFYTDDLRVDWLALAIAGLVLIAVMRRVRIWYTPVYLVAGFVVWYAAFQSGVHATIAGVAIGALTPVRPLLGQRRFELLEDVVSGDRADPVGMRDLSWQLRESVSVATRLIALLSPWTSFAVVPLFALANAGVPVSAQSLSNAASSPATLGVAAGLLVGKPLGVVVATWATRRAGIAELPLGVTMRHVVGIGFVAGIGFTVALFIAGLAFEDPQVYDQAVIGVLAASLVSAGIGAAILGTASRPPAELGAPVPADA